MSNKQKLSKEDNEILKEMEDAGEELPADYKPKEDPVDVPTEEDPKEDDPKEDAKPEEDPKEVVEDPPKVETPRPEKYMPLDQHQEHKRKWQESEATKDEAILAKDKENETLRQQLEKSSTKSSIADIATKFNVDPDLLTELAGAIKGQVMPSDDVLEKIDKIQHDAKVVEQSNVFEQQFISLDLKSKYPDSTPKQIAEAKEKLYEVAHTSRYSNYPLQDIISLDGDIKDILEPIKSQKTLESGKKPTSKAKTSADERLENIDDLSDKELDELMDELEEDGSKFNIN